MNKLRNAGGEKWWFFHLVKIHNVFTTAIFSLVTTCVQAQSPTLSPDNFVTTWRTFYSGETSNTSIMVPMVGGPYDADWNNDGIFDEFGLNGLTEHDFSVIGTYTIRIRGNYDSIRFSDTGDQNKIFSVDQWGTNSWISMENAFSVASQLTIPATDTPDFGSVTSMRGMFNGASLANPDTSGWDTSSVTDMSDMFRFAISANPDTSGWDTSLVTSMKSMFDNASSFDQDIGSWDVSALLNAFSMFRDVTLSTFNYEALLIGWSAQILNSTVNFDGGNSKYCSLLSGQARITLLALDSWLITDGGHSCSLESCNINVVSGEVVNSKVSRESCEILAVGPSFNAQERANVTLSSGWEVQLLPGFSIEKGAELTVNVCGQSLCMTSDYPMPYGCHPCVNRICDIDPSCCSVEFASTCLTSVHTYCGLLCE